MRNKRKRSIETYNRDSSKVLRYKGCKLEAVSSLVIEFNLFIWLKLVTISIIHSLICMQAGLADEEHPEDKI